MGSINWWWMMKKGSKTVFTLSNWCRHMHCRNDDAQYVQYFHPDYWASLLGCFSFLFFPHFVFGVRPTSVKDLHSVFLCDVVNTVDCKNIKQIFVFQLFNIACILVGTLSFYNRSSPCTAL